MRSSASTPIEDVGLSAPAVRALTDAGYTHLQQLAQVRVSLCRVGEGKGGARIPYAPHKP